MNDARFQGSVAVPREVIDAIIERLVSDQIEAATVVPKAVAAKMLGMSGKSFLSLAKAENLPRVLLNKSSRWALKDIKNLIEKRTTK